MARLKKTGKRIAKIAVILYIVVICVPVSLYVLIRTPVVQHFIIDKTTNYLSEKLETKVSIGAMQFNFFLDIVIEDLEVYDKRENPLVSIDKLVVGFSDIFLKKKLLVFKKAILVSPVFHLRKYEGETENNMQFLIDFFSGEKKEEEKSDEVAWRIYFRQVQIHNAEFSFVNENKQKLRKGQIDFNNLHIRGLEFLATNVMIGDTVQASIRNLMFAERSGFVLKHFKSDFSLSNTMLSAKNMVLLTQGTKLNGDIEMVYESTRDFNDFVNKVKLKTDFRKSIIDFSDLSAFAPEIPPLRTKVFLSGKINGTIANMSTKDLIIEAGRNTKLFVNCMIMGLPDAKEAFFDLSISHLSTTSADLVRFATDLKIDPAKLKEVNRLAAFNIQGSFIGFLNSFYADFNLQSNIGSVIGKMSFKEPDGSRPSYNGTLQTNAFDIGKLLQNDMLGVVSSNLKISGEGLNVNTMKLNAEGNISQLGFNGYVYKGIALKSEINNGRFDGYIAILDDNIEMDFDGMIRFNEDVLSYSFIAKVQDANLNKLKFNRNDSLAYLTGVFDFQGSGNSLDDFLGTAKITNLYYSEGENDYFVKNLMLKQDSFAGDKKRLIISSDVVDGFIEGNYTFSDIPLVVNRYLADYITRLEDDEISQKVDDLSAFNIKFGFEVKDFDIVSGLFIPELEVARHTNFSGNYNGGTNALFSNLTSPEIIYSGVSMKASHTIIETFSKNIYVTVNASGVYLNDSVYIKNFVGNSVLYKDNINFSLFWDNYDTLSSTAGDLKGFVTFPDTLMTQVKFSSSSFTLQNKNWNLREGNSIRFFDNMLLVSNLYLSCDEQEVFVDGVASKFSEDELKISFKNFELNNLQTLLNQNGIDASGELNGTIALRNLMKDPFFTSRLRIKNLYFEDKLWGDFTANATFDNQTKALYADVKVEQILGERSANPIGIKGYYYTDRPGNELDFVCTLSAFEVHLFEPFLADQVVVKGGRSSGRIEVKGDVKKPDITGKIWFMRTIAHVNYLNTLFVLNDTIHISKNLIYADRFMLSDAKGKNAEAIIKIQHQNFSDIQLDIKLQTKEDFVFMNTGPGDNPDFYGTVVANGFVHVTGTPEYIVLDVTAKTGRGTQFFLPMDGAGSVYESNFITFVSDKKADESTLVQKEKDDTPGFRMNLNLDVTPDAEMQIIFDPKIGDIMRGKASGNLRIDFDLDGDFFMYGDLELVEGDYLFTLENVINKKFFIYPGGRIQWEGDPYNAIININTYYPIRTRLFDLVSHIDSSEVYRKKVPVNLELLLENNLMTPDITFNISLPQSDENTKNIMKTAITSDQEMNRQVFSLLILNSFVPPETSFAAPLSQGVGTTSMEFVSNQFSNWLSQISKDFDIGVNYRPGGEVTTDEIEVMVSTQLFNDRIRIEGNVGVGGNQVGSGTNANQNVMGDVVVENKLTPDGRISLKAFNRSNPIDAIAQNSPYTQGVGVFYRKDFDTIRDLLKRRKKVEKDE